MNPTPQSSTSSRPGSAVVLGGGPAGLACGHWLAREGVKVRLLEAKHTVGGLCMTNERDGFRFDFGGHRWFTKNEELNEYLKTLMGDELIEVPRTSRIYFHGKYFQYPIDIMDVLKNAGVVTCGHAFLGFCRAQVEYGLMGKSVENMADGFTKQFGKKLFQMFFERYSAKVWGRPCHELSSDWVSQRSRGVSTFTAIKNAIAPKSVESVSLIEQFLYPKTGYVRISERMAEQIERSGSTVSVDAPVVKVLHKDKHVDGIVIKRKDGVEEVVTADAFVSTIPLTHLVLAMSPEPPPHVMQAATSLTYRSLITVNMMIAKPQATPDTWLYVHDERVKFARLHEPRNWSPYMAPPGKTSLCIEYFCDFGDEIWSMPEQELCDLAVKEICDVVKFVKREEVIGAFTVKARYAYPIYDLEYRDRLRTLKAYIAEFDNIQITGRAGTFRYDNSDHAMEGGILAAKNLLGGRYDLEKVHSNTDYDEVVTKPKRAAGG